MSHSSRCCSILDLPPPWTCPPCAGGGGTSLTSLVSVKVFSQVEQTVNPKILLSVTTFIHFTSSGQSTFPLHCPSPITFRLLLSAEDCPWHVFKLFHHFIEPDQVGRVSLSEAKQNCDSPGQAIGEDQGCGGVLVQHGDPSCVLSITRRKKSHHC